MLRIRVCRLGKTVLCLYGVALGFIGWINPAHAQSGPSFSPPRNHQESVATSESKTREDDPVNERRLRSLSRSLNDELLDLSRAFRSLDQSFHYRGIVSRKAGTASSAYADWRAQGIDLPRSTRIVPPMPRFLGCGQDASRLCDDRCEFFVPLPRVPECTTCQPEPSANIFPRNSAASASKDPSTSILDSLDLCTVNLEPSVVWQLKPSQTARLDAEGLLAAGTVHIAGIDDALASAIRKSNACTVRFTANVSATPAPERTVLVHYADRHQTHFAVLLKNHRLFLELTEKGETESITLARLDTGVHQVVLCLEPNLVRAWVDNQPATSTRSSEIHFSGWTTGSLVLGSEGFDALKSASVGRLELSTEPIAQ